MFVFVITLFPSPLKLKSFHLHNWIRTRNASSNSSLVCWCWNVCTFVGLYTTLYKHISVKAQQRQVCEALQFSAMFQPRSRMGFLFKARGVTGSGLSSSFHPPTKAHKKEMWCAITGE